jgi:hypothetical protein
LEQNEVGKCLGVCHEMQCVEWRGTWPSPMVREQGEGGEGDENVKTLFGALEEGGFG